MKREVLLTAFEQVEPVLRRRYSRELRSLEYHLDLDDLIQGIATRAFRSAERCRAENEAQARAWLYVIAKNTLRSAIRKYRRIENRLDRRPVESVEVLIESRRTRDPRIGHLVSCMERLPAIQQAALRLRYIYGHDYQEVANQLGLSVAMARLNVSRGLAKLRLEKAQPTFPCMEVED